MPPKRRRSLLKTCALLIAGAAFLLLLAVGFAAVLWQLPECENEILAEYRSPDGQSKAIVFTRNCGATTEFNTQVSLLLSKEQPDNHPGNALIADTDHGRAPTGPGGGPEISVQWINLTTVVLSYPAKARIFLANAEAGGIQIQYRPEP